MKKVFLVLLLSLHQPAFAVQSTMPIVVFACVQFEPDSAKLTKDSARLLGHFAGFLGKWPNQYSEINFDMKQRVPVEKDRTTLLKRLTLADARMSSLVLNVSDKKDGYPLLMETPYLSFEVSTTSNSDGLYWMIDSKREEPCDARVEARFKDIDRRGLCNERNQVCPVTCRPHGCEATDVW